MNTDRELLEAAAKAAGIKALRCPNGVLRDCTGLDPAMNIFSAPEWNPLTDDGDALRLAVKLKIELYFESLYVVGRGTADDHEVTFYNGHPYAATRRAIVRAAAEIGRSMK